MQDSINENDWLRNFIRDVPDFPSHGINFKDITPLLADSQAFQMSVQKLADMAWSFNAEAIVAIESRGFIFGAPVAFSLGVPFVPIRKKGKLPGKTVKIQYSLEYGQGELEMPLQSLKRGTKAVIIDDVLATGGTAKAARSLISMVEAETVAYLFLAELAYLKGSSHLGSIPFKSLISYS
jgi:adenine phosphoribosyltransferase